MFYSDKYPTGWAEPRGKTPPILSRSQWMRSVGANINFFFDKPIFTFIVPTNFLFLYTFFFNSVLFDVKKLKESDVIHITAHFRK